MSYIQKYFFTSVYLGETIKTPPNFLENSPWIFAFSPRTRLLSSHQSTNRADTVRQDQSCRRISKRQFKSRFNVVWLCFSFISTPNFIFTAISKPSLPLNCRVFVPRLTQQDFGVCNVISCHQHDSEPDKHTELLITSTESSRRQQKFEVWKHA